MPNLTQSTQIAKRAAIIFIILAIIIIFIILIFLRFNKSQAPQVTQAIPSPPAIIQNLNQQQPKAFDFSQTKLPQIPNELATYQAQTYNLTDKNYQDLASIFSINATPFLIEPQTTKGKQLNWEQGKVFLTINQIDLRYENQNPETGNINLAENQLQQKASDFIQKIPIVDKNLVLRKTNYLKLSTASTQSNDSGFTSAPSFENSDILEFTYDKKLSEYPLYQASPDNTYTTLRITRGGTVIYFSSKIFQSFSQLNSYQLKSPQEAIKEIENGQGKIVQTLSLDQNNQALELFRAQPQAINITNIKNLSLAYFLPSDITQLIQPIFVADGQFKTVQGQNGEVVIYLPAIQ